MQTELKRIFVRQENGSCNYEYRVREYNSSKMYMGSGIVDCSHFNVRTTTRKPSKTVVALFQGLRYGSLRRKDVEDILCAVNGRPYMRGYSASMFAYHVSLGRIERSLVDGKPRYSLTDKGIKYALDRDLFSI